MPPSTRRPPTTILYARRRPGTSVVVTTVEFAVEAGAVLLTDGAGLGQSPVVVGQDRTAITLNVCASQNVRTA